MSDGGHYFDRQGRPVTMWEWVALYETADRRVALTQGVGDDWVVSTVWLGLDHRLGGSGPPLIYESAAWGPFDDQCQRYPTEVAALAGHDQLVAWVVDQTGVQADDR